ncbi:retrovirus-related Pol polyprotein from transposon opus [Trichonephila clavipes]|nr:retrovirus-related Pol polyprotein from transposon opus [Trichonephila clavipes]
MIVEYECGLSFKNIARRTDRNPTTAIRIWKWGADDHTERCTESPRHPMNKPERTNILSKKIDLIQLARDLDESPDPSISKIVLRDLIISSKYYKEEEAKELLEVITAERNANQSATQNNSQTSRVKSLDEIVKMVKLLTVKVPNKSDGWDYFFSSLEKAFASENVSDELKPKVLLCMLGDNVSNLSS